MSYCRFENDSDVYCLATQSGYQIIVSKHVQIDTFPDVVVDTLEEFKSTLLDYKERGLRVPDRALERIEREMNT